MDQCWNNLLGMMAPQHREMVSRCSQEMSEQIQAGQKPLITNALFWAVVEMVFYAAIDIEAGRRPRPLDMRPHIAEIYIQGPDAIPLTECPKCRYRMPAHIAIPDDGKRRKYFHQCPVCAFPLTQTTETAEVTTDIPDHS